MFARWHWTCLFSRFSLTVPAEANFLDHGDSESNSSFPTGELVGSQPMTRPQHEGTYQCEFCPYFARHLRHVTEHERTHAGEKSFRCSVSNRSLTDSHDDSHGGETILLWGLPEDVCKRGFLGESQESIRARNHTGVAHVRKNLHRNLICRDMREPTVGSDLTSVKPVRRRLNA